MLLQAGPSVRALIATRPSPQLHDTYNECLKALLQFRNQHKQFAYAYIAQHSAEERGTGGSDFMPALAGYVKTTSEHLN